MLVLSRKDNETIEFPALGVVIRVFGLTRKRVQLGIDAPISLKVTRGEKSTAKSDAIKPAESIAEHILGQEFERLESELSALAELSSAEDRTLAGKVASDAIDRVSRMKSVLRATFRQQEQKVLEEIQEPAMPATCVRQSPADYSVCMA